MFSNARSVERAKTPIRLLSVALGIAVAGSMLAACGEDSDAPATSDKAANIRIVPQGIVDSAPIWIAVEKGYFKDEGVDVTIVSSAAGSSAGQVPLLMSNTADLVVTTATAALQSSAAGLPTQIAAGLTEFGNVAEKEPSGLLVSAKSDLKDVTELVGKKVAVSGLKSLSEALVRAAVAEAGADDSKVQFIQVPMPNIANVVTTGGADAGFVVDPFLSDALAAGQKVLARPAVVVAAGAPTTSIVGTKEFLAKNADAMKRFNRALTKAITYANEHPDEVLAITAKQLKLPGDTFKTATPPIFNAKIDRAKLTEEIELLHKFGALEQAVKIEDVL